MTASAPGLSLRRQLLIWLLLPQLVLWAGGGLLAYRIALSYAEKGIDQSLTQSVRALARQVKPIGSGLLIDFPRAAQDVLEQDPEDRIVYMVSAPPDGFLLGNQRLPQPTIAAAAPGEPLLYSATLDGKPMRFVAMEVNYGEANAPQTMRVQVGKSLAVYGGIQRGLAPLTRLTAQLENRSVNALSPIGMTQAPNEVHALVEAINGLLGEVARNVNQEKRFISDAAHQLRTPLAGLISQLELAQRENTDAAVGARLNKVRTGAERSAHLVHQLLTLARTETTARREPLDLAALAREVAREWTPKAVAAGVDLGFEGDEHREIQGDALQLREAMANLIDNALRYTPRGSAVTLKVEADGERIRLLVEDNGPGLSESDMEHVFQRFWRASEQPGGCGLGLAIVSEIARRHGGQAHAERVSPQGFRVVLTLA